MRGEVVYSNKIDGHKPQYQAGLCFQGMSPVIQKQVEDYLENQTQFISSQAHQ